MAKIGRTYGQLSHQELQNLAYSLGISGIDSKPDSKLRKDIIAAHAIQKIYEDRDDVETHEGTIIEQLEPWKFAHDLRASGISNDSIRILVENGITTKEALKQMAKDDLKEIGIKIGQAAVIVNSNSVPRIEKNVGNPTSNYDITEEMRLEAAYNRFYKNRYPHSDTSFVEFLENCEKELVIIDEKKEHWIDYISALLFDHAKDESDKIKRKNGRVSYDEWRQFMIRSSITSREKAKARNILFGETYNGYTDPFEYLKKINRAIKLYNTNFSDSVKALIMATTVKHYIRIEFSNEEFESVNAMEAKIIQFWQKNRARKYTRTSSASRTYRRKNYNRYGRFGESSSKEDENHVIG